MNLAKLFRTKCKLPTTIKALHFDRVECTPNIRYIIGNVYGTMSKAIWKDNIETYIKWFPK